MFAGCGNIGFEAAVGVELEADDGGVVGSAVGCDVGAALGAGLGASVGLAEGVGVGDAVGGQNKALSGSNLAEASAAHASSAK